MAPSLKRSHRQAELDITQNLPKKSTGSPSRAFLTELSLQNEHYYKELFDRLERDEKLLGKTHAEALAAAAREHERVRAEAQRAREWNMWQREMERRQVEDELVRELDRQRQEKLQTEIEEQRRRTEEVRRQEEQLKQAEQERKEQEEKLQRLEATRKEEAEQANQRQEATEEAAKRQIAEQSKAEEPKEEPKIREQERPDKPLESLLQIPIEQREATHRRYLDLHRWLKEMRKDVIGRAKKNPQYKKVIGDWRREITKRVGQLTREKNATLAPRNRVAEILREAKTHMQITVDVRPCFPNGLLAGLDESNCQVSGLLIYELNILAKSVINQWAKEASAKTDTADPPGIMATFLFGIDDFRIQGHSLIDILLAKFHKTCPILFGIYGNEKTESGRARLGWRKEGEDGQKQWVSEQSHNERMIGLAAGYASIALRDFSRAPFPNPYPPKNYWASLANIVNTTSNHITQSHLVTLKALIENSVERFAKFYGNAARVALKTALVDFPQKAPDGPAKTGLATLPAILTKNYGIRL